MTAKRAGGKVLVHPSSPDILKVTTPFDLRVAELVVAEREGGGPSRGRVGEGSRRKPVIGRPRVIECRVDGHIRRQVDIRRSSKLECRVDGVAPYCELRTANRHQYLRSSGSHWVIVTSE